MRTPQPRRHLGRGIVALAWTAVVISVRNGWPERYIIAIAAATICITFNHIAAKNRRHYNRQHIDPLRAKVRTLQSRIATLSTMNRASKVLEEAGMPLFPDDDLEPEPRRHLRCIKDCEQDRGPGGAAPAAIAGVATGWALRWMRDSAAAVTASTVAAAVVVTVAAGPGDGAARHPAAAIMHDSSSNLPVGSTAGEMVPGRGTARPAGISRASAPSAQTVPSPSPSPSLLGGGPLVPGGGKGPVRGPRQTVRKTVRARPRVPLPVKVKPSHRPKLCGLLEAVRRCR